MSNQSFIRLIAILPAAFLLVGAELCRWALLLRDYTAPAPGLAAGAIICLASLWAIAALLAVSPRASRALIATGIATWIGVLASPLIVPIVNASSEPPSFVERFAWLGAAILVPVATAAAVVALRAFSRAASYNA